LSKEKDLERELEEGKVKADRNEQTLANFIVISFIWMVAYKLMTGTF